MLTTYNTLKRGDVIEAPLYPRNKVRMEILSINKYEGILNHPWRIEMFVQEWSSNSYHEHVIQRWSDDPVNKVEGSLR